jgi:Protein of unknown function (DUF4230)
MRKGKFRNGFIEPMNRGLQILIGLSILVLAVAFAVHLTFSNPVKETARTGIQSVKEVTIHGIDRFADVITNCFAEVFHSQVNISSSTTICDATPIAELAVLKRNIREIVVYSNITYYGYGAKRIVADQTFTAKIGFDLAAHFSATFDPSNNVVTISLPNPKVLSLEPVDAAPTYYAEDSSVLNRLTTADYQIVLVRLKNQAAQSAESVLAVGDAKQMIETRFHDLFQAFGVNVRVEFQMEQTNLMRSVSESAK